MGNTLAMNEALERRRFAAKHYIDALYPQAFVIDADTHDQYHSIGKHREEKPLHAFVGANGFIQAWDVNGISVVTHSELAIPIMPANEVILGQNGFSNKQVKDARLVLSKLNMSAYGETYTTGIAHCISYEPVCYVHNSLLRWATFTTYPTKYDSQKMTSICVGGVCSNINNHILLNLVRPLVGERILSKRVRVAFKMPRAPVLPWTIDDFFCGDRFKTITELRSAYPDHVVVLSEDNITVEYQSGTDETLVTLPYLFYIQRTELKKMVVVPIETGRRTVENGGALLKAGKAVETANTRR